MMEDFSGWVINDSQLGLWPKVHGKRQYDFGQKWAMYTSPIQFQHLTQGSKYKTNKYQKVRLQSFDMWCKNDRQMC